MDKSEFDKAQKKQIETMNDIASNSMQCGTPQHSLCGTCRNRLNCRLSDDCGGCFEYERQSNPLDEIVTETRSLNPIKEEKSMRFEEALKAMLEGKRAKRACYESAIAYSQERHKFCFWCDDDVSGRDGTHYGCEVEFSQSDRVADDWCVISDIPSSVIKAYDMATKERIMQSLNTYIEMFGLPYDNIKEDTKKMLVNWMDDTLNGRWTSLADMAEKERDSMNNYEKIEITFKSGETISYGKDEWDDYAYDGKAVIVKKNSAWIGIYNFDDVFCVELK
jgi:hypothetical protein